MNAYIANIAKMSNRHAQAIEVIYQVVDPAAREAGLKATSINYHAINMSVWAEWRDTANEATLVVELPVGNMATHVVWDYSYGTVKFISGYGIQPLINYLKCEILDGNS